MVTYLSQRQAQDVDAELMSTKGGFAVEQLMELAGFSVAQAIFKEYSPDHHSRALICAGPGNNGGDGLVAARHLKHFGYTPIVYYPKRTNKDLYKGLVAQLQNLEIRFVDDGAPAGELESWINTKVDLVVDAIFGFSFSGEVRAPFREVIEVLKKTETPIVSVDIPSGWHVEEGNVDGSFFNPSMLVSLTAPKACAKKYTGKHWLGGRFIPPEFAKRHNLDIPRYPVTDQCVKLNAHL